MRFFLFSLTGVKENPLTTGNVVKDNRAPFDPNISGRPGKYYSREWYGADWPVIPKVDRPSLPSPVYLDKKGRKKLDKAILANNRAAIDNFKAQMKARRARVVKRQRERRYEQHSFSCYISERRGPLKTFRKTDVLPPNPPVFAKGTWDGMFGTPYFTHQAFSADRQYRLVEKLKSRLVGSDFHMSVFLGESHQALTMIFNAARRLNLAIRAAKRGRWGAAVRALRPSGAASKDVKHFYTKGRTVAGNWLELMYGWLPLVDDLQEGARMLAHMNGSPCSFSLRVKQQPYASKLFSATPTQTSAEGKGATRLQIIAFLTEVDVAQLTGLKDWQSLLWERLPWSFICDWVIPIGNYLSARGIASALKGTFVTTQTTTERVSSMKLTTPLWEDVSAGAEHFERKFTQVARTVSSSLPVPKPEVHGFSEALSWRRAANAVALLIQQGTSSKLTYSR